LCFFVEANKGMPPPFLPLQKVKCMDTDELKQKELIRLEEIKREIREVTRDLEQLNKSRKKIGQELKELSSYQEKSKKQYQKDLLVQSDFKKEIEKTQENLHKLENQRKEIIKKLNGEILEKTKELNNFKNSKKDFISELKRQEKELEQRAQNLEQRAVDLSNEQAELRKKEELLKNGLISAKEREKIVNDLQARLNRLQGQIQRQARVVEGNLTKIEQIKQGKEQELKKQQELTKSLENKLKIFELKIEAQDRREAPVRKLEQELKKKELKLIDDRQSLQRAWAELKGGG